MDPKLVRIKRNKNGIVRSCDLYIGRACYYGGWALPQSKWHNPFTVKQYGSVEKVCEMYLEYIINSDLIHDLPELGGKTLGCWCDPPKEMNGFYCHGCVLIQLYKLVKSHHFDTKMVQLALKKIEKS